LSPEKLLVVVSSFNIVVSLYLPEMEIDEKKNLAAAAGFFPTQWEKAVASSLMHLTHLTANVEKLQYNVVTCLHLK
jgi:hypothetical protein